jgi:hypothetical protein
MLDSFAFMGAEARDPPPGELLLASFVEVDLRDCLVLRAATSAIPPFRAAGLAVLERRFRWGR